MTGRNGPGFHGRQRVDEQLTPCDARLVIAEDRPGMEPVSAPPSAPPNRAWTTPAASGSAHPSADQQPHPASPAARQAIMKMAKRQAVLRRLNQPLTQKSVRSGTWWTPGAKRTPNRCPRPPGVQCSSSAASCTSPCSSKVSPWPRRASRRTLAANSSTAATTIPIGVSGSEATRSPPFRDLPARTEASHRRAHRKVGLSGGRRQFRVYKANGYLHVFPSIRPFILLTGTS